MLTQDITYNALNKAATIAEGEYTLQFLYGHDKQRRKTSFYDTNGLAMEKYFAGLYEKEIDHQTGIIRHINYIMAGDGITAIVLEEEQGEEATFREYAQKFVSGAINSYVGPSLFANDMFGHKVEYMRMSDGSYLVGSKKAAAAWRQGWLNQSSDFAHSSQEAFNNRSLAERLMMFGGAGASYMIGGRSGRVSDYFIQQTIHASFINNPNYSPLNYEYAHKKLFIILSKNLFYNLK